MTTADRKKAIVRRLHRKDVRIDVHTHVGTDPVNFQRGDYPYAQSAEDLRVRLDRWALDAAVCFPFLYTSYFALDAFVDGRMRKSRSGGCPVPYAIENERLCREIYEAYPACAGRLLPFMFFDPSRDPQGQVAVIDKLSKAFPLFGLKSATSYIQSPITDLLKRGACLLDFASRRNLPVTLHTSVFPGDPWADVHAILDVVRARPDVRFGLAHTCRFDRRALDKAAELPNCFVDFSAFHIHCKLVQQGSPAIAAKMQRFTAPYRRHAAAMAAFAEAYPDMMMWGTDSPYYCFMSRFTDDAGKLVTMKLQCDTDTEINEFRKLPPATQRRLGHDNIIRYLFG